jgi:GT2 family glycosyltransferase
MSAGLSVVIPNYNGRDLLAQNLPSLIEALKRGNFKRTEIIVSDDASQDDSVHFLQNQYPDITLVKSQVNTGFSGAVNRGLALCGEPFVLLLNSDITLTPDFFQHQMPWFDNPEVFGVMSRICSPDGGNTLDAAKYPGYRFGNIYSTVNYEEMNHQPCPTLFLSGANALVRRSYLEKLGGLDEIFNPYYCEDVDLGIRAWRAGWICMYEPRGVCYHPVSATIGKEKSEKVRRISTRNKALLHLIHTDGSDRLLYLFQLIIKINLSWLPGLEKYSHLYKDLRYNRTKLEISRKKMKNKADFPFDLKTVQLKIKDLISPPIITF